MPEAENVASVRRFVDAFNRREMEAAVADLDPDVELREWPAIPGARSFHGPAGVLEAVTSWFETWEWMQVELEDVRALEDRVLFALHHRAKGRGSGVQVEITSYNVYTFRDGKVTRIELFTEQEPALEAAGLTPDHKKEKR